MHAQVPSDSESEGRYMDPVTKVGSGGGNVVQGLGLGDVFTNSHKIVILAPTGDAVLKDTWLKALRQDGHYQGEQRPHRGLWRTPACAVATENSGQALRPAALQDILFCKKKVEGKKLLVKQYQGILCLV
eukprot:scaffold70913_cov18-Tisochrysis_lutea.AAC.2